MNNHLLPPWPQSRQPWLETLPRDEAPAVQAILQQPGWHPPKHPLLFIGDLHANPQALLDTLVLAGCADPQTAEREQLQLTLHGQEFHYLLAGDYFDKGSGHLPLLRLLAQLRQQAPLELLIGNHDLRWQIALQQLSSDHPLDALWITRLGGKSLALLGEICTHYPLPRQPASPAEKAQIERILHPTLQTLQQWGEQLPKRLGDAARLREQQRLVDKAEQLAKQIVSAGLTPLQFLRALHHARQLLLPQGEFAWFFTQVQLATQHGSWLFLHAGVDNRVVQILARQGVSGLNRAFARARQHPGRGRLYFSALANALRTKYRISDDPLQPAKAKNLQHLGIRALVHGHRDRFEGQQLRLRAGLLHLEGNATLDRQSRLTKRMTPHAAACLQFLPDGQVLAHSSDYPYIKHLRVPTV